MFWFRFAIFPQQMLQTALISIMIHHFRMLYSVVLQMTYNVIHIPCLLKKPNYNWRTFQLQCKSLQDVPGISWTHCILRKQAEWLNNFLAMWTLEMDGIICMMHKPTVSSQWQTTPCSGEYSTKVGDASQCSSHTSTLEKMGKPF
jgi:hypothetical protein